MARGINKVILVGNLGADPEMRYTGTGTAVCNMRLATNEAYKDQDGNMVDKTEWHQVVAWSRLAEICGEYLKKGSQVYFEGSLQTRSYDDKDGITRYTTEIKAREMMMLGGRGGDDTYSQAPARPAQSSRPQQQQRSSGPQRPPQGGGRPPKPTSQAEPDDFNDSFGTDGDDLPF